MRYLSPVLHLLFPICQPFASLLLLSQRFLGLGTQIHILDYFADLFASFGGAFTVAGLVICIICIALLKYRKIQQAMLPLNNAALFLTEDEQNHKNDKQVITSTVTFSMLESDNQMQGTCFFFS